MNKPYPETIVAVATPPGLGGIGIVRVSGADSLLIAKKLFFFSVDGSVTPRHVYFGKIMDIEAGTVLDEGCVVFFKGPASYTGEDSVEFQCHSSPYVLERLVTLCCGLGARVALPGEFTKQAFINGKIDLTQAEGVIDLIHSTSQKAHAVSLNQVQGKLYTLITSFRETLKTMLEQIDASLDFPEEVESVERSVMRSEISAMLDSVLEILKNQDFGQYIFSGVSCVIVGKPNAGKSSLFNALVGMDRAIVTDIEGTTRDYLETPITLGGVLFRIVDTAGVRESQDYIEYLGIQKIQQLIDKADVVLFVCDSSRALDKNDEAVIAKIAHKSLVYCVKNKSDLKGEVDFSTVTLTCSETVLLSAVSGAGVEDLKKALYRDFVERIERVNLESICTVRQLDCLRKAAGVFRAVLEGLVAGADDASLAIDVRRGVEVLGELTGDVLNEELLDGIFSRFCIGK